MAVPPGFLDWCAAAGITTGPIAPTIFAGGERGVVATGAIGKGDVLVAVPDSHALTLESARDAEPEWDEAVARLATPLAPETELGAFLVFAANRARCRFHPYAATLPQSYTLPFCFSGSDADALGAGWAVAAARGAAAAARAAAAAAAPLLRSLGLPTDADTFTTALCAVRSRSMHHPGPGGLALLPLGDLFNHGSPPAPCEPDVGGGCGACAGWHGARGECPARAAPAATGSGSEWGAGAHDAASRCYVLSSRSSYAPGDQVLLAYGAHDGWACVEHYGFCPGGGHDPHERARVAPSALAARLPPGAPPIPFDDAWVHAGSGAPGWALLAALRRATAGARRAASPAAARSASAAIAQGRAASAAGDAAALTALAGAAGEALAEVRAAAARDGGPEPPTPTRAVARAWRAGQVAALERAARAAARGAAAAAAERAGPPSREGRQPRARRRA